MGSNIKNITIFGCGFMGSGIAQVFASKGFKVIGTSVDPKELEALASTIESNMRVMFEKGICTEQDINDTLSNITTTSDVELAVKDADLVIESIVENMEIKQNLFEKLDGICKPETILATNTSVMSITEIGSKCKNRHRVVGTHFWNPPFLIPLVEVIKTEFVSHETIDKVYNLLLEAGKRPVKVNKDVPGFLANRLQHALWREAISIVERGIADAKTVDESIKYGFGLRLPQLGPMENADMVGTDLTLSIHSYILKHIENSTEPSPLLKEKVANGELGFKSGKGFQEWTPEEAAASKKGLLEYLLDVTNK